MNHLDTAIGVFPDYQSAEKAIKSLADAGFDMKDLTLVGRGYHSDEKVTGFYSNGDRIKFWGTRGAFWGMFFGGMFMTIPVVGHVIVLGYLAAVAISGIETAALVGGLSALGAALYGIGIPKDSVINYEADIKVDRFLVMAHGTDADVERARKLLSSNNPLRMESVSGKVAELA
jgi:uncharacterized membrane protein